MASFLDEQREQARPMAYHEAGHLCVAEHLGFQTDGMDLNPRGSLGADGGAKLKLEKELKTIEDICGFLRSRLKILYAGSIAEAVVFEGAGNERANEILENQGKSDNQKAASLLILLCNITLPLSQNDEIGKRRVANEIWNETLSLVEEIAETIRSLAVAELDAQFKEPDEV